MKTIINFRNALFTAIMILFLIGCSSDDAVSNSDEGGGGLLLSNIASLSAKPVVDRGIELNWSQGSAQLFRLSIYNGALLVLQEDTTQTTYCHCDAQPNVNYRYELSYMDSNGWVIATLNTTATLKDSKVLFSDSAE